MTRYTLDQAVDVAREAVASREPLTSVIWGHYQEIKSIVEADPVACVLSLAGSSDYLVNIYQEDFSHFRDVEIESIVSDALRGAEDEDGDEIDIDVVLECIDIPGVRDTACDDLFGRVGELAGGFYLHLAADNFDGDPEDTDAVLAHYRLDVSNRDIIEELAARGCDFRTLAGVFSVTLREAAEMIEKDVSELRGCRLLDVSSMSLSDRAVVGSLAVECDPLTMYGTIRFDYPTPPAPVDPDLPLGGWK